jgi:DNA-binding beta-propeller fold protein YncE
MDRSNGAASMRFSFALSAALITLGGFSYGSPAPAAFSVAIFVNGVAAAPGQFTDTGVENTFEAAVVGNSGGVDYQWDFGDTTSTVFDSTFVTFKHTYTQGAHLTVRVNVVDAGGNPASATTQLLVRYPIPAVQPTNSSTIILDATNHRVWCVNADQDTVTAIDSNTNAFVFEKAVGKNPRTLAQAADGTIWVVSQQHPSISVLDPLTGALLHVVPLPHGSLPYGIAMTPDGSAAYVTFQGSGGVAKFSTSSRNMLASTSVPPSARGVSVASDGRVYVTRFLSPQSNSLAIWNSPKFLDENRGEVVELNGSLGLLRTIKLVIDPGLSGPPGTDPDFGSLNVPPTTTGSRGVPNYLTSMVIMPDGRRAFVPSKKDNVQRGSRAPERDGRTPSAETTYRAIVSSIDLSNTTKTVDELSERFDVDNSEMPQAACASPNGDYLFVALQGNNLVQVRERFNLSNQINGPGETTGTTATNGLAPQGLVLDPGTKKLFVHNYMGRTISIFNATNVLASHGGSALLGAPTPVSTITGGDPADLLGTTVLRGKRVFYNSGDPRMSKLGYISCAGCHLDGGSDMRVFDFTNRGEGLRNTIVLQGRGGTGMGNVHWSANFNEIQDFDNDVYKAFHDGNPAPAPPAAGPALSSFTTAPWTPLDPVNNNGSRDPDLDAMAAYVGSLAKVSRSPFRKEDGTLTPLGASGEAIFKARDCQKCHKGRNFSDSQVGTGAPAVDVFPPPAGKILLHDVGTLKLSSGNRLGGALPGIDTPTLKGVWQSAPYLHDGSAPTMVDVFKSDPGNKHFGAPDLTPSEQAALAQYMIEIDEVDAPPVPSTQVNTVTLGAISSGRPYSFSNFAVGSFPFIDRSYALTAVPLGFPNGVLLRTAEDDKENGSSSLITFTLPNAADVHVFYDNRAGANRPTWLDASWAPSGFTATVSPGQVMTGYIKTFSTGLPVTVTLGGNLQGGPTGALRNYFVMIDQGVSAVYEEGPLSRTEWVHDRDADGDGLHDEYEAVSALSPWVVNSGGAGTIPDEDKPTGGGTTRFADQAAFEFVAAAPAGGGGGGCGFTGLEPFALAALAALLRRRAR